MTPDGTARVLYRGPIYAQTDPAGLYSYIIELSLAPGGTWQQADLTDTTRGAPYPFSAPFGYVGPDGLARVVGADDLARVVYTGSSGDIIELRLDGDGWVQSDLTVSVNSPPAPPAASAPFAYVTPDKVDRVYYSSSSS